MTKCLPRFLSLPAAFLIRLLVEWSRGQNWTAAEGGFSSALELVKYIRARYGDYFSLSVAGYPEGHPDNIDIVKGGVSALTPSEARRARVVMNESLSEEVSVCSDANFEKELCVCQSSVSTQSMEQRHTSSKLGQDQFQRWQCESSPQGW